MASASDEIAALRGTKSATFKDLLTHPSFSRLLAAMAVSSLGDWVGFVAVASLVTNLAASPASKSYAVAGVMTVTDYALNLATFTSPGFNIDKTPPTISGAPDRAANTFNWYKAPVTVTFTCTDPNPANGRAGEQSGIASCTAPVTVSSEGTNQSVPGTAFDVARNSNNTTVSGINIDTTAPTIASISTSGAGIANGNGDLNAGKTVTLTVNLSNAVTVNTAGGSPRLLLNDGGIATSD